MTQPRPLHSVSVAAAVIDDDGRVLVIRRRDNGKWEPPGGVLEVQETITDGLVREVLEETGLLIEPLHLTGVYKNMSHPVIALVFRCRLIGGSAQRATAETQDLAWLSTDQIPAAMDEAYAVRLLDARDGPPAKVREHDGVALLDAV